MVVPSLRLALAAVLFATGCSLTGSAAPTTPAERSEAAPTSQATIAPDVLEDWSTCAQLSIDGASRVEQGELAEASGLAASLRYNDVLWSHNDSGSAAGVFGVGLNGDDLGFFNLVDADGATIDGRDIEDIAYRDGRIHLADIGDNDRLRESVQIYSFDEPEPGSSGSVTVDATIDLTYPDERTDAEALLVDPISDEVVILSKDLEAGAAATRIYSFTMPPSDSPGTAEATTIEMAFVGEIDVAGLESQSTEISITAVLFPGLLTAADITPDGRLIAVRTYGTVWLYPRALGQTMAEALLGEPCEGGTAAENQGEALAFLPLDDDRENPNTISYVTVSEGTKPVINVVTVELG